MPKSATTAWPLSSKMLSGLMYAVHHIVGVGVAQGVGHLPGVLQRVIERLLLLPGQAGLQRLALHLGHDVMEEAVPLARNTNLPPYRPINPAAGYLSRTTY